MEQKLLWPPQVTFKNRRVALKIMIGIVAMLLLCVLMTPMYHWLSARAGINGRGSHAVLPQVTATDKENVIDPHRDLVLTMTTTPHANLAVAVHPVIPHLTVHPGQKKTVYFYVKNNMEKPITLLAIPSIQPGAAARFVEQLNTFSQYPQRLLPGEAVDLPWVFRVGSTLPQGIHSLIINMTLTDASAFKHGPMTPMPGRIELTLSQSQNHHV